MKRTVSAFFLLIVFHAMGQHGEEWIQFDRPYFKIPIAKEGLYRLSYQDLQQAGFDVSANPKTFQLFHRGIEQSIIVQGEDDQVFHPSDFIEFFGRGNDGALDSSLYAQPHFQPHRLYNLYSDTTFYFLTYGSDTGKRMPFHSGPAGTLIPETHHLAEKLLILKDHYSAGADYGNVQLSIFDEGEGWMGAQILQNQEVTYSLDGISEISVLSGKPVLELLLTGRGPMTHAVEVYAGSRLLSTVSFSGYQSYKHTQEIEWSDIDSNGKFTCRIKVKGSGEPDRVSAGYIRLTYPQLLSMAGATERIFSLRENANSSAYIRIQNPSAGTRLLDVTDPVHAIVIGSAATATLDALILGAGVRKIFATSAVRVPQQIKKVTFRRFHPSAFNYLIITHPSLRKPAMGYTDPVKAYGEYRALPEGGGFDTLIVNITRLYDQFNYGEQSPRAIFQFLKFCASVKTPDYLFLIGKGLDINYGYYRNPAAFPLYKDLVPTAGYPASDMAFSASLSGNVATGRLTATSPAEVAVYLNKIKERDALPFDDLNRKKVLHLSGGIEEYEPVMFRNILADYATVVEGKYLGAHVQSIAKRSTAVKLVNIAEQVNQGLGLITFFGHSAPNTTDFDIGHVTDPVMGYNNKGKYPMLLMNGCNAGSFFLNTTIFGENWINAADKGAVGFIAHSSYGLLSGLQRYSSTFYDVAFADSVFLKRGVGKVQQEVVRRYIEKFGNTPNGISQVQQMVLLGDPAVKLFGAENPDYAIDGSEIFTSSFDGEPITAYTDSFLIHIPVKNLGIAGGKKIRVEVSRRSADQPSIQYEAIIDGVLYLDTISMLIRNADTTGFGVNVFSVSVDADDLVVELSESNNTAEFQLFIPSNGTRNLYPYNFSIVRSREADLSFQYTDILGARRTYLLEIDTASTFDSGYKKQFQIDAQVLGRQHVELLPVDSLVYYWRTKLAAPLDTESKAWTTSSFSFIEGGQEGWAQMQFPQFMNNVSYGLVKDPALRKIHYEETISDIAIRTFSTAAGKPIDSVSFKINGVEFNLLNQGGACRNNTINLIAFDRNSTQPYAGLYFTWYELLYQFGGRMLLCGREPYVINSFKPNELVTGNGNDLIQYVDNIAEGDSVVLFSMGDAGFLQWPEAAKAKLSGLGIASTQLDGLQNGEGVVIFARKGSTTGSATVFKAPSAEAPVQINKTIAGRFSSGTMTSAVIGPAQRWETLVVRYRDAEPSDHTSFSIVGIKGDGDEDTLKTAIQSTYDLSFIDAQAYPHLKVVFHTRDDINLTSVQLDQWLVVYEPVAEGLVFFRGAAGMQVLSQGQTFRGDFGFVNVSEKLFADSLLVRFDLSGAPDTGVGASTLRISPPLPGDTTLFTIDFKTEEKAGINDVEVFVNPRVVQEKSFDNNLVYLHDHVQVMADDRAPVIDVTIDGRHVENNEYVSVSPDILITVWDENPFMLKTDTAGVNIFLALPCETAECAFRRIHFSRDDIAWEPATATSRFAIHFTPANLSEGTYTLRVEAKDDNGNQASQEPYEITFRVDHNSSVVVSSPYPNPFSIQTTFDVLLTGEESPSFSYILEIASLDGRLVGRFSHEDEQGVHVGTNRIDWDGTGADGKSLPDGIYLYRLSVGAAGVKEMHRGKIVLSR
ncbi:MAG: C25 family cysteine peptidase [Chryseosolibacter sp.]